MSNKLIKDRKSYSIKDFSRECIDNFNNWLKASSLSLDALKKLCETNEFICFEVVLSRQATGRKVVGVFYKTQNNPFEEKMMGLPFVAPSMKAQDEQNFLLDAFILLVYLAKNLDTFSGKGNDFCFNAVMEFGKNNHLLNENE